MDTKIKILMLGPSLDVKGGITSVEKLILQFINPPINIKLIPTFAQGSAKTNILVFLKAIITLFTTLLTGQGDIIHVHFAERGSTIRKVILIIIALIFGKPIILHAHGATYQEFYAGLPPIIQKILANLMRKSSKLIALSQSWHDYYLQTWKMTDDQVVILNNPVEIPPHNPNRSEYQQIKFVFLGRIGRRGGALDQMKSVMSFPGQDKGAFDLIRAFSNLHEIQRNQAELILAGNGDIESAQKLVHDLGMSEKITIYSWLNPEERDKILAEASVFILPSYNEGLPMSMLEAMAWGLAIITTPVGGIPEVIINGENGLLVEPGNQAQITQAMGKLIDDKNLRLKLGEKARNDVHKFDIYHYISDLTSLYLSVVNK